MTRCWRPYISYWCKTFCCTKRAQKCYCKLQQNLKPYVSDRSCFRTLVRFRAAGTRPEHRRSSSGSGRQEGSGGDLRLSAPAPSLSSDPILALPVWMTTAKGWQPAGEVLRACFIRNSPFFYTVSKHVTNKKADAVWSPCPSLECAALRRFGQSGDKSSHSKAAPKFKLHHYRDHRS